MLPTHCQHCQHHKVISDRHPVDHFNDDDCAVVCTLVPNPKQDPKAKYPADRNPHRVVGGSLRPYEVRKLERPDWCPLVGEVVITE